MPPPLPRGWSDICHALLGVGGKLLLQVIQILKYLPPHHHFRTLPKFSHASHGTRDLKCARFSPVQRSSQVIGRHVEVKVGVFAGRVRVAGPAVLTQVLVVLIFLRVLKSRVHLVLHQVLYVSILHFYFISASTFVILMLL